MLKNVKHQVAAFVALAVGLLAAPAAFAQAALPAGVEAEVTNAGEVMVLGATAIIIAMVGFWGVKKMGTKLGWF